jgi:hypothetical protein
VKKIDFLYLLCVYIFKCALICTASVISIKINDYVKFIPATQRIKVYNLASH